MPPISVSRRGFSLIEIVITLVIIGILAAFATVGYRTLVIKMHNEVALNELESLHHVARAVIVESVTGMTHDEVPAVVDYHLEVPAGQLPTATDHSYLSLLLSPDRGPQLPGAPGIPSMSNHQVSIAFDEATQTLVTVQQSKATGYCARSMSREGLTQLREAVLLAPSQ